jgi:hypothetical protein
MFPKLFSFTLLLSYVALAYSCDETLVQNSCERYRLKDVFTFENAENHIIRVKDVFSSVQEPVFNAKFFVFISWSFNRDWDGSVSSHFNLDEFRKQDIENFKVNMTVDAANGLNVGWEEIHMTMNIPGEVDPIKEDFETFIGISSVSEDFIPYDRTFEFVIPFELPAATPAGENLFECTVSYGDQTWLRVTGNLNKPKKAK